MKGLLIPTHKKAVVPWSVASTCQHNASGVENPEQWLWQRTNGIYYPYIKRS